MWNEPGCRVELLWGQRATKLGNERKIAENVSTRCKVDEKDEMKSW